MLILCSFTIYFRCKTCKTRKQGIYTLIMDGLAAEEQLGPAAAYSAQVATWLQQAYQAQLMQYGKRPIITSSL